MKKIKKTIVSGLFLLTFLGGSVPAFATDENEKNIQPQAPVVAPAETKTEVKTIEERYRELLVENDDLHNQKHKLEDDMMKLKSEKFNLEQDYKSSQKRVERYKRKLKKKEKYVSPEEMDTEIESVKAKMILKFTEYMSEYIKQNPSKKMKNVDMKGLFSNFMTFNVNYNNSGDTSLSPITIKGVAKGTVAGAAIG